MTEYVTVVFTPPEQFVRAVLEGCVEEMCVDEELGVTLLGIQYVDNYPHATLRMPKDLLLATQAKDPLNCFVEVPDTAEEDE